MRKVAVFIIGIGLTLLSFYYVYNNSIKENAKEEVETYIDITKIKEDDEPVEQEVQEEKEEIKKQIDYKAVLEIPVINLKNGLVEVTKDFKSINYAISIDNHSTYPDKNGNFILYAHSGRSSIAFFRNLNKVNVNDKVFIYYEGSKYGYKITNKYDVEKTGLLSVDLTNEERLITLITCNQDKKGYQVVLEGIQTTVEKY